MEYVPAIGLEIHAELKTATKMFCASKNDSEESRPNVNICPVCLAHPGVLPVINREAVKYVLKVGVALKGELADYTEFDRKSYFYPDLPKGYQLSQYEYPLVSGGVLNGVSITRVHLEEDTASSIHDEEKGTTVIDFNRAGVPLMELVTEPQIQSAREAGEFARELQLLLKQLGVSDANMEKGEMRVEANVSVARSDLGDPSLKVGPLGTKVEIKNLNSFRAMERAVEYEIKRQSGLLERGEKVVQETRGWDEAKQTTFPQRSKEGSADYRYFPDPDLPSLTLSEITEFSVDALKKNMTELPWERRDRYLSLGIKPEDAKLFARERVLAAYLDELVLLWGAGGSGAIGLAANYLANDVVKIIRDIENRDSDYQCEIPISARNFRDIIDMVLEQKLSSRAAKDILLAVAKGEATDALTYATARNLLQGGSADIASVIESILADNPAVVKDYKAGKTAALEYLVGQAMKATRGAADPHTIRNLILSKA